MGDDIKGIYSTISVDCSSIDTLLASIITYHSVLRLRAVSCFFSSLSDTISDHQRAKSGKETPAVKYEYATVAAFNTNLYYHCTFLDKVEMGDCLQSNPVPATPDLTLPLSRNVLVTDCLITVPRKKMMFVMSYNKHFVDQVYSAKIVSLYVLMNRQ